MKRYLWLVVVWAVIGFPVRAQEVGAPNPAGVTIHVVQRGESLYAIALRYGVTTETLVRLNGIANPNSLQVGERLLVPASDSLIGMPEPQIHTVRPGETLRSIAALYGRSPDDLAAQNGLADPNSIFVGQVLYVATAGAPTAAIASSHQPSAPSGQAGAIAESVSASPIIHVVQRGETLFRIATRYGLTVNDLAQANQIADPTLIYAGQQILIPVTSAVPAATDLPADIAQLDIQPLTMIEGQSACVRLITRSPASVRASFLGRVFGAASEQNSTVHMIFVGIPMFTEAGIYPLELTVTNTAGQTINYSTNIQVVAGNYGSEYINLLAGRAGLLDPAVETAEQNLIQNLMSTFSPTRYFNGAFGLPAAASMTSPYGRRRSYNGGPFDRFHSGTDFAGVPGTPVLAAAPGYVVLSDQLNIRGNATVIDHGWGVFTGYWHQNERYAKAGDFVQTGQIIGTIGATGRVTGAHLHWELWVNGVAVDPMQWVRQSFYP